MADNQPAADGKLTDFFVKFADNAHLGKIGTDFAPGIILTTAILMAISSFTDIEIFPYAERQEYERRAGAAQDSVDTLEMSVRQRQGNLDDIQALLTAGNLTDQARADLAETSSVYSAELMRLLAERTTAQRRSDSLGLVAQDVYRLGANVDVLRDHFVALFVVGYFVGILLAQISGKLFYNGAYYKYFKDKYNDVYRLLYPGDHRSATYYRGKVPDQPFLDRLPDLEASYYRYLEVAMNMVLPVAVLSVVLAAIGASSFFDGLGTQAASFLVFAAATAAASYLLYLNGRVAYVGYFFKKADVLKLIQEHLAESAAIDAED